MESMDGVGLPTHQNLESLLFICVGDRREGAFDPQNLEKYFSGKYVKFGHFVNFSYIYFRESMSCPTPKVD